MSGTKNLAFNLVILMRIPPYFLSKSRVLHLVCTPTGVYSRKRVTFCFSKLYLCQQLWMEMEIMLGSSQEFYFKVLKVQHWVKDIKNLVESQEDLIWRFLTRRNLFVFPCIPKGVFVGHFTQMKFTVIFHLLNSIQNAGQHIQSNSKSFQTKAITSSHRFNKTKQISR